MSGACMSLWEKQLYKGDYLHFPHLAQCDAALVDIKACISVLSTLRNEFSSRFTDVRSHSQEFKIVTTPFDFPYDDAPSDVQLELIELQALDVILSKFTSCTTLIDFYRQLPHAQFPMLLARAKRVIAVWKHLFVRAAVLQKEVFLVDRKVCRPLVYLNDCANELDCDIAVFADDLKLWRVIQTAADEENLQSYSVGSELGLAARLAAASAEPATCALSRIRSFGHCHDTELRWGKMRECGRCSASLLSLETNLHTSHCFCTPFLWSIRWKSSDHASRTDDSGGSGGGGGV
ncbi:unnamed protein product [Schistocephalus solidus]|uniref:DHC_N2 domain-containing protein n=1 Tax=Schistocephalus solidus TaxID=70667 RepID=A0A183TAM5_SCHSO|nr:unnamed protein product [Schistocephalus solidus]